MSARARVRRQGDERLFMTLLGCTSKATDYEQKGRLGDMRQQQQQESEYSTWNWERYLHSTTRKESDIRGGGGGGGETGRWWRDPFFPSPSEASVLLHCVRIIFLTNTHVACSLVYAANVLKNIRRSFYTFLPAVVLTQQILSWNPRCSGRTTGNDGEGGREREGSFKYSLIKRTSISCCLNYFQLARQIWKS